MNVSGICHYNLRAPRALLDSLCSFYSSIVGLSVGPRPPLQSFGYWLYAGDKDVLHLTESRSNETRAAGTPHTFDHVAFSCSDAPAYEARLRASGISYQSDTVPSIGQFQLFFSDPAGNGVELNFPIGVA